MIRGFRLRLTDRPAPLSVQDWRERARRSVPAMVWAHIENGADDERTLRENEAAYQDWYLNQRVPTGTAEVDLGVTSTSRECSTRTTPSGSWTSARTASSCPTTAAAN